MGNIPILKPTEVVAALLHLGFSEVRQRGSHKQFRHADGRAFSEQAKNSQTPLTVRYACRCIPTWCIPTAKKIAHFWKNSSLYFALFSVRVPKVYRLFNEILLYCLNFSAGLMLQPRMARDLNASAPRGFIGEFRCKKSPEDCIILSTCKSKRTCFP